MMNRIFAVLFFLTGLMVLLVPRFILPVCEYQGYSPMACSHTAVAEMFMGVIVMAAAIGLFFSSGSDGLRWLSFTTLASGVSVIWIPQAIGYCHSGQMPCNYATIPVLRLLGALTVLISLAGFLLSFRAKER